MKRPWMVAVLLVVLSMFPSPEHARMAAAQAQPCGSQVAVAETDGTGQELVTSTGHNFDAHWSRDGKSIVATSDRTGGWDVYVHPLNDGADVRLSSSQDGSHPDWSPKNDIVIFSYNFGTLGTRKADGTGSIKDLPKLSNIFFTQPKFSPDGQLIAAYGETINGGTNLIYLQNADGSGKPSPIEGQQGVKNWYPAWKSDTELSYVSMRADGTHLVTYNLATKKSVVEDPINGLAEIAWSSNGTLAYTWYRNDRLVVSLRMADGTTNILNQGSAPAWAPDGSQLLYTSSDCTPESGWQCPIPFSGFTTIKETGTDPFTLTVTLPVAATHLSVSPPENSNLEPRAPDSWNNPSAGNYASAWKVHDLWQHTVSLVVDSDPGGYASFPEQFDCIRVQPHLAMYGAEAVHLEGLNLDETIAMNEGVGQRLWLDQGAYVVTPIISGTERLELRKDLFLVGNDGIADWRIPVTTEVSPTQTIGRWTWYMPTINNG